MTETRHGKHISPRIALTLPEPLNTRLREQWRREREADPTRELSQILREGAELYLAVRAGSGAERRLKMGEMKTETKGKFVPISEMIETEVEPGVYEFTPLELETVIVTRHPALVQLLCEQGICPIEIEHVEPGFESLNVRPACQVLTHVAAPEQIRGKRVIGNLPLSLAAEAAELVEIPLAVAPEDRGRELGIERLREIAGEVVTYRVSRIG